MARPSPHHAAAFLGAFLLFSLELMAGKLVLPLFGGGAAVWTACMTFFQGMLLAGYLYAHLAATRLPGLIPRGRDAWVHLAVLAAAAFSFPIHAVASGLSLPAAGVAASLALSVGAPFFALSATVTTIHAWLERSDSPERSRPYSIYAASNAGALAGLLAYPFAIEPLLSLPAQILAWEWGYGVFVLAHLACLPARGAAPASVPVDATEGPGAPAWAPSRPAAACAASQGPALPPPADPLTAWRFGLWLALSAGPCAAMLAATRFLTQDIASAPLFWVIPLGIYLATFIFNFKSAPWRPGPAGWALFLLAGSAAGAAFVMVAAPKILQGGASARADLADFLMFVGSLVGLFLIAMACHRALAEGKPSSREGSSVFYLAISMGGLLGGLCMSLLVPWLGRGVRWASFDWMAAGALSIVALAADDFFRRDPSRPRPRLGVGYATLAGALVLCAATGLVARRDAGPVVLVRRGFYGILKVRDVGAMRYLTHNRTIHGMQYRDPAWALLPLSYYHPLSPVGDVMRLLCPGPRDVGVVGLGAGSMAAWGVRGSTFTFYEIDPDVAEIAASTFTYLSRTPASVRVVLGDARLSLERAAGTAHDLLVVDAFSGDSIPTHLLTAEALALYFRRLKPGGILLLHLSNDYLSLESVPAALAPGLGASAATKFGVPPDDLQGILYYCQWAALSKDPAKIALLRREADWLDLSTNSVKPIRPWTDGWTSILPILSF